MTRDKRPKDKDEAKEPLEYRRFKAMLRKVVKAPPLRKKVASKSTDPE